MVPNLGASCTLEDSVNKKGIKVNNDGGWNCCSSLGNAVSDQSWHDKSLPRVADK
jgi:hypothetical protein